MCIEPVTCGWVRRSLFAVTNKAEMNCLACGSFCPCESLWDKFLEEEVLLSKDTYICNFIIFAKLPFWVGLISTPASNCLRARLPTASPTLGVTHLINGIKSLPGNKRPSLRQG